MLWKNNVKKSSKNKPPISAPLPYELTRYSNLLLENPVILNILLWPSVLIRIENWGSSRAPVLLFGILIFHLWLVLRVIVCQTTHLEGMQITISPMMEPWRDLSHIDGQTQHLKDQSKKFLAIFGIRFLHTDKATRRWMSRAANLWWTSFAYFVPQILHCSCVLLRNIFKLHYFVAPHNYNYCCGFSISYTVK